MDDPSSSDSLQELTLQALALVANTNAGKEVIKEKMGRYTSSLTSSLLEFNVTLSDAHSSIRTLVLGTTNWRLAKYGAQYLAFVGKQVPDQDGDTMLNEDVLAVAEVSDLPPDPLQGDDNIFRRFLKSSRMP
jgi:hypothetical protein